MKVGIAQDVVLSCGRFIIIQFDSDKSHRQDENGDNAEKSNIFSFFMN